MNKPLVVALVVALVVVCCMSVACSAPGTVAGSCERAQTAQGRVFGERTDCTTSDDGGFTLVVRPDLAPLATCTMGLAKCTEAQKTVITSYLECVEQAPTCAAGQEARAVNANLACTRLLSSLPEGCNPRGLCDRINTATTNFFGGKTECKSSSGGTTTTVTKGRPAVCAALANCSAADLALLETYTRCLEGAARCAAGSEKEAVDAFSSCVLQLVTVSSNGVVSKLSSGCSIEG
jgi:hypothetical protein